MGERKRRKVNKITFPFLPELFLSHLWLIWHERLNSSISPPLPLFYTHKVCGKGVSSSPPSPFYYPTPCTLQNASIKRRKKDSFQPNFQDLCLVAICIEVKYMTKLFFHLLCLVYRCLLCSSFLSSFLLRKSEEATHPSFPLPPPPSP